MKFVGATGQGTVIIEMTVDEWQRVGTMASTVALLADQVVSYRKRTGQSQEKFAARAGISRTYLSLLETGHEPNISLDIFWRIHEAMGLPPERRRRGG